MDGYLFDTNTLSALLDPSHSKHADASAAVAALNSAAPKFVSVVALAELQFGKLWSRRSPARPQRVSP